MRFKDRSQLSIRDLTLARLSPTTFTRIIDKIVEDALYCKSARDRLAAFKELREIIDGKATLKIESKNEVSIKMTDEQKADLINNIFGLDGEIVEENNDTEKDTTK